MTPKAKREFIKGLTASVLKTVLGNVEKMPSEWDGHELRRYLADKFDESASFPATGATPYASRRSQYRNTVLINNL